MMYFFLLPIAVEISIWSQIFKENVFIPISKTSHRITLLERLLGCNNIEKYSEINECYLMILNDLEKNNKIQLEENDIKTLNSAFKIFETTKTNIVDIEKTREKHLRLVKNKK